MNFSTDCTDSWYSASRSRIILDFFIHRKQSDFQSNRKQCDRSGSSHQILGSIWSSNIIAAILPFDYGSSVFAVEFFFCLDLICLDLICLDPPFVCKLKPHIKQRSKQHIRIAGSTQVNIVSTLISLLVSLLVSLPVKPTSQNSLRNLFRTILRLSSSMQRLSWP